MSERIGLTNRNWLFLLVLTGMVLPQLRAQAPTAPLVFEVVSVKVEKPGEHSDLSIRYLPGGRFSATGVPIPLLILDAYDSPRLYPSPELQKLDLSAIERNLYDIEAVAPKGAIPPGASAKVRNEKIREMLQSLLADRFKLKVHHEMKEQPVYAIVIARNGPKFQSAAAEECADSSTSFFDPGSCHSMADLMKVAQRTARLELPLVDKTGLTGLYHIQSVDWSAIIPRQDPPAITKGDANIQSGQTFDDMLARLGLKLEMTKAAVDMLIVEHVEPPTIEN